MCQLQIPAPFLCRATRVKSHAIKLSTGTWSRAGTAIKVGRARQSRAGTLLGWGGMGCCSSGCRHHKLCQEQGAGQCLGVIWRRGWVLGALLSELDGSALGGVIRRLPLRKKSSVYYKEKL